MTLPLPEKHQWDKSRLLLDRNSNLIPAHRHISLFPDLENHSKNLEDEWVRSCDVKKPQELTGSDSLTNYKRALRKITNLDKKLKEHHYCNDIKESIDNVAYNRNVHK